MIGKTGMVDNFDVSLISSFLMKLEMSETSKQSTIPVLPIMSKYVDVEITLEVSVFMISCVDLYCEGSLFFLGSHEEIVYSRDSTR